MLQCIGTPPNYAKLLQYSTCKVTQLSWLILHFGACFTIFKAGLFITPFPKKVLHTTTWLSSFLTTRPKQQVTRHGKESTKGRQRRCKIEKIIYQKKKNILEKFFLSLVIFRPFCLSDFLNVPSSLHWKISLSFCSFFVLTYWSFL